MKIMDFLIICILKLAKRYYKTETLELSKRNSAIGMPAFIFLAWATTIFLLIDHFFIHTPFTFVFALIIMVLSGVLFNKLKKIYIDDRRLDMILENNETSTNVSATTAGLIIYGSILIPLLIMICLIVKVCLSM